MGACHAVVLSIPVRQYKQVLTQFLPVLPPSCLIFDAGSTKSDVAVMLDELEQLRPAPHPDGHDL